jgi:hypothetical protein
LKEICEEKILGTYVVGKRGGTVSAESSARVGLPVLPRVPSRSLGSPYLLRERGGVEPHSIQFNSVTQWQP